MPGWINCILDSRVHGFCTFADETGLCPLEHEFPAVPEKRGDAPCGEIHRTIAAEEALG